jgi:fibronectin-binding autotransporter adhesin
MARKKTGNNMNVSMMRRFALLLAALSGIGQLGAQTAWQPTMAGTYNWLDNANWSPATAPNSTNANAGLSADLAGAVTINLGGTITLDQLTIGDPSAGAGTFFGYTIAGTAGQDLLFNNTDAVAATLTKNGSANDLISARVVTNDSLAVTVNAATLTMSGGLVINGNLTNGAIEAFSKSGGGTLSVTGNTTLENLARVLMSAGTMNISGALNIFKGQVQVGGGTLNLSGINNVFLAPPAADDSIYVTGGALQLGSSTASTYSFLAGPVNMTGSGTFNFGVTGGAANVVLNSNSLTMNSGTLRLQNGTGGGTTTVLAGSPLTTTASTVNANDPVIATSDTSGLAVGMRVYGPGIPDGAYIQSLAANTSITLNSGVGVVAGTDVSLMFGTGVAGRTGDTTLGSNVITGVSNASDYAVGQTLTGDGIPFGARIASIGVNTLTLDVGANATATSANVAISSYAPGTLTLSGGTTETNQAGSATGSVKFDPSISLTLANNATLNFSDNTSPVFTRAVADGSNTIKVLSTTGFAVGQTVTGTGIPTGSATITAIGDGTITLTGAVVPAGNITNLAVNNLTKTATITNNSAVITGLSNTTGLAVGMTVTGTNIAAGAVITAINSSTSVTLSVEAVGSGFISNFTATVPVGSAATVAGSNVVRVVQAGSSYKVGDSITGTNIPVGSQIVAINGNLLTLNQVATATGNITNLAVNQNLVLNSINSTSNSAVLRLSTGNGILSIGNYSGVNDVFNGSLNFASSGSSARLIKVGSNTLTLGGTLDNSTARVEVQEGNLILAKDSLPTVHAIGSLLIIGDADAATETVTIGGTFAGYNVLGNLPSYLTPVNNYRDQIVRTADVRINASGVLDLNGNSEGFNALMGEGLVRNNGTTPGTLIVGQNNSSSVVAASIQDGTGTMALIKGGVGTMMFHGNNSFTGSALLSFGATYLSGLNGSFSNASVLRVADATLVMDNTLTLISSNVTDGSKLVTTFNTRGLAVGAAITGTGIAAGTTVTQILSETQFLMSNFGTSTATGQTFVTNQSMANSNRIGDSTDVYLSNATFTVRNAAVLGSNIVEKMGDLVIDTGHSVLRTDHVVNVANLIRLDFDSYSRIGGGMVSIVENTGANGFGTNITPDLSLSQVTVANIPTEFLIGGDGEPGTNTVNLLLGAFGGNASNSTAEFMTVQSIGGINYIRPLNAGGSEYSTVVSGNISSQVGNVSANTVISANTAYNSLRFINQDRLITISDGVTLKLGGNSSVNFDGLGTATITEGAGMMIMNSNAQTIRGGTLDFGSREFILRGNGSTLIQSTISGTNLTNGLIKGGGGHLDLLGANTYTGETVVAQGSIRVFNSLGLGAGGAGNGTRLLTTGFNGDSTLILGNGVIIGRAGNLENLIMENSSRLSANDQNNVLFGDIIVEATNEGGQNNTVFLRTRSDTAILTIKGNVTGGVGTLVEPGFTGGSGRLLALIGDNLRDGIINITGSLSDQDGLSAINGDFEKLNLLIRGTTTPNLPVNEFAVNINDASNLHGTLDLRSGIVRLAGNYGTGASFSAPGVTTGPTVNMVMRLRESGTDSPNQIAVFSMTNPGSIYNVSGITWADANGGYSATSYGMLAAEINTGIVTIGNGTGSLDLNPAADNVVSQAFTGTGNITLWDGVVSPSNPNLNNIVTLSLFEAGKFFGNLRPGMQVTGNNVPVGTYIVQLDSVSGKITLNNAITGALSEAVTVNFIFNDAVPNNAATQQYADARLYAMEGGELNLRMRVLDDGGFSLQNEVGALTKVGRGVVRLSGAAGLSGEIDGGVNLHSGTLVLDYTGIDPVTGLPYPGGGNYSGRKLTSGANQQVPITLAGGDLYMIGNETAASTVEEMRGVLFMRPGESLIRVQSGGVANTATLNIGLPANLLNNVGMLPVRYAGSSVVFWRDTQLGGNSEITLEIPDPFTGSIVLPWAVMAANSNQPLDGVYRGKVIDFATVSSGNSATDPLGVRGAGDSGLFFPENGGQYFLAASNATNTKSGYIIEGDELVPGEGSGFFGYVDDRVTFGNIPSSETFTEYGESIETPGPLSGVRILFFNVDNDNANGSDLGSGRGAEEFNNVLRINAGKILELQSNESDTGLKPYYLGGAILIANTVGDTNKEITGGSLSSGLVTNYFDPDINHLLVKTYDLIIHNYANNPNDAGQVGGVGGIFTIGSNIVNNPGDSSAPLNLVHNGTGTTRMILASTLGSGYGYTGSTFFNGGVIWASDPNKLGANPGSFDNDNFYFTGGELLIASMTDSLGTTGLADNISSSNITLNANRGITLGGDGGTINVQSAGTTFTINSKVSVETQAPTFAGGTVRTSNLGLGDFYKTGAGTVVLTNQTNTYSGITEVKAGTLQANLTASVVPANLALNAVFQNQGVLGSSYTFIDGTYVDAGARLNFRSLTAGFGSAEWITLDGGTLGTAADHVDGNLEGVLRVRADSTIDVLSGGILRLNTDAGYMEGAGKVTKTGAGTLALYENSTEFTGNWEIQNGRVIGLSQGLPLGSGTSLLLGDTNTGTGGTAELVLSSRITPTVVVSNVTTTASTIVTMTSTDGLYAGMRVSGAFIPAGAVIVQVLDGTRIVLSSAASAGTGNITATLGTAAFPLEYTVNQNITVQSDGAGTQVKRLGVANHSLLANSGQQNDVFSFNGSLTLNEDLLLSYADNVVNTGITATGRDAAIILDGNISGSGNLKTEIIYTGDTTGISSNDLRIYFMLHGNNSGWTGGLTMGNTAFDADLAHIVRLGESNTALNAANNVTMGFNSFFQIGGRTVTIGNLTVNPSGLATTNQVFVENAANEAGVLRITQTAAETWDAIFRDGVTPGLARSADAAVTNNSLGIVKLGGGVAQMNQTNTYSGVTQVGSANGVSGGTLQLVSGGSLNSASALTIFAGTFDNNSGVVQSFSNVVTLGGGQAGSNAVLSTTGTNSVIALENNVAYDATNNPGGATISGKLDLGVLSRTFTVGDSTGTTAELTLSAAVAGAGSGIVKEGQGALVLSGVNTFTGATVVKTGALVLDYSSSVSSKLSDTATLTLSGGSLVLSGGASAHTETVLSTILTAGTTNTINRTSGTSVLQMNTITVGAGASVNFIGSGIASTDNLNTAAGILGSWATITIGGVTDWAMNSTNSADGLITAFTGYTDINRLGPASAVPDTIGANVRIINGGTTGNITLAGGALTRIGTLKMNADAGPAVIDPTNNSDVLNIGDDIGGGIIVAASAGALTIGTVAGDGVLTSGGVANATDATLSLINESTTNSLIINSVVANNGTDVVSITKSGAGVLTLNGANTYGGSTHVNAGTVIAGSSTAFGGAFTAALNFGVSSTGRVKLNGNSMTLVGLNTNAIVGSPIIESGSVTAGTDVLTLNLAGSNTYAGMLQDGGVRLLALTKTGAGTLTLSGSNTYSGLTTITGGTVALGANNALGSGGVTVDGGTVFLSLGSFSDSVGTVILANGASITGSTGVLTSTGGYDVQSGSVTAILSGAVGLTKTTAATVTLSGANSFTGVTTITAGVLNIQNNTALGTSAGGASVASGAALQLQSGVTISGEALSLNGTGISNDGALRSLSGSNTYAGLITLAGATRINADAGSLALDVVSGSAITGTQSLTFGGAGVISVNDGIATGTGSVTKDGLGTLNLAAANTYSGLTTVSSGTLNVLNGEALGATTSGTIVNSGAVLQIQGNISVGAEALDLSGSGIGNAGALRSLNGNNTYGGLMTFGSDVRINTDAGNLILSNSGTITGSGFNLTVGGGGNTMINGVIGTGSGVILKEGGGTLTLTGGSTYTGLTTVSAGVLNVRNATALGTVASGTVVSDGAALQIQNDTIIGAEALSLTGMGVNNDGALRSMTGNNVFGGLITLGGTTRINAEVGSLLTLDVASGNAITGVQNLFFGGAGNINVNDAIATGTGSLTKDGSGTLTLVAANTYTGLTTISNGTVTLGVNNAFATGGVTVDGAGAVLNMGAFSDSVGQVVLANGGSIIGTGVLTSTANFDFRKGVASAGLGGAVALNKTTLDAVTLGGANTFTGATSLAAGTLTLDYSVNNTSKLANGAALNLAGGTLELSGGSHTEVVLSTSLAAGTTTTITRTSGTSVLQMNTITVGTGSLLNLIGSGIANTDNTNTNGILGSWATVTVGGITDWAVNSTNGADGLITAYTGYTNINRLGVSAVPNTSAANVRIVNGGSSGNITLAAATTLINTLKMSASLGAAIIDPGSTDVLNIGGDTGGGIILDGPAGALTIGTSSADGRLTTGGTVNSIAATLNLINNSTVNALTINSTIQNNGTDTVSVTKAGNGLLRLNSANTYTGLTTVTAGKVTYGVANAISTGGVTVDGATAILDMATFTDTVGQVILSNGATITGTGTGALSSTAAFDMREGTVSAILGGSVGLNKTTLGTVVLSAANTYTGTTAVTAGVLNIRAAAALGTTAAGTTVSSGAALEIQGGFTVGAEVLTLNGTGVNNAGALRNVSGTNIYGGLLSLGSSARINADLNQLTLSNTGTILGSGFSLTVGGAATTQINGILGLGTGGVNKDGAGTLILIGANTYTGATMISAGSLRIQNALALGNASTGTTVLSGAQLQIQGTITVAAEALTISGTGINNTGALRNLANFNILGGAITLVGDARINSDSGDLYLNVASGNAITGNFNITFGGNANVHVWDTLSIGANNLTKDGGGTLLLRGAAAHNYSGATRILAGALRISTSTGLGTTDQGTFVASGGRLELQVLDGGGNVSVGNEALTLNGVGSNVGALRNISGVNSYAGQITLGGTVLIFADTGSLTLNVASGDGIVGDNQSLSFGGNGDFFVNDSIATGTGALTKIGAGNLTLNAVNKYTGTTTVSAGGLIYGVSNAISSGGVVVDGLTAVLNIGSFSDTVGAVTLANGGIITGVSGVLSSTVGFDVRSGTALAALGGAVNLVKTTNGTVILQGSNTFTGSTTVNLGTLKLDYSVNNNSKLSDVAVLTLGGGTIELSGGSHLEVVGSTTLLAGTINTISRSSGTAILQLNTITPGSGSLINFTDNGIATTDNLNVNGILGGWATVTINGVTDWAVNSTNSADGLITAFAGPYTDITRLGVSAVPNTPSANVRIINGGSSGSITLAGGSFTQINTLKMDASAGSATIDPTGANSTDVFMIGGAAGGGIIQTATAGALTIGAAANDGILTTGGTLTLINDGTTNALTINSIIANNGGDVVSITKGGAGLLVLNGSNTYTGITAINAGTLRAGSVNAFGSATTATLAFGAGSTGKVQLFGNSMTVVGLTSNVLVGTPIVESGSGTAGTDTLTVGNAVDNVFAGILQNGGTRVLALTKTGTGILTLSGLNTYTGLTTVNAGTLALGVTNALGGGGALTVDGATAIFDISIFNNSLGTIILANGGSIVGTSGVLTSSATYDFRSGLVSANLAGGLGLTKTTSGVVVISGNNTYTGVTTVSAGVIQIGSATPFGGASTATLLFSSGTTGKVQLNGNSITLASLNTNATVGTPVIESGSGAVGIDILTVNNAVNNTYAGVLQDGSISSLALIKSSTGMLTLTGANTYTGETNVNNGVLNIGHNAALGSTQGGTTVASGAALQLQGGIAVGAEALSLAGTGIGGTGALRNVSGNNSYAGQITLVATTRINSDSGTLTLDVPDGDGITGTQNLILGGISNIVVNDAITTGTGTLTKDGSGTVTLAANNTYTGATFVNAGTLKLDYSTVDDTKLFDATTLTLGGGTIELSGGSHVEVVANTVLVAGTLSTITRTSGTSILQLNTITPGVGAVVNFLGSGIATTDNLNNASGILGGWATITIGGVTDWAVNSTNSADGLITAFTGYTDITRLGPSVIPNTASANIRIVNGGTSGNITMAATTVTINSLKMDASAGSATIDVSLSAATDTLSIGDETGGGIILSGTAGALTIGTAASDGRLTTGGAANTTSATLNIINDHDTNAITINSIIQDNGTDVVSIVKGGVGNLILAGANTYTGTTTITGGTLTMGAANVISTGGVTVDGSTAVFSMGANSDSVGAVILANGGSITGSGTLTSTGGFDVRSGSIAAKLAGSVGLTKNTDGTVTLSGANTYTGVTTVNGGTLVAGSTTAFGAATTASVTMTADGRLQLNGNSMTLIGLNGSSAVSIVESGSGTVGTDTLTVGHATNASTYAGILQDGSTRVLAVTKNLAGTLTFTGANAYSGATLVSAGVLNIQNGSALGAASGGTTVSSGAALQIQNNITVGAETLSLNNTGVSATGALRNISGNNTYGGAITIVTNATRINSDAGTLTLDVDSGNAITSSNIAVTFGGAGNITVMDGIAIGSGTVTKDGTGTLALAGASTYTGATTISGGAINIRDGLALGTTANGTTVNSTFTLQIQGNIMVGAEALSLNNQGVSNLGALRNISGDNTWGGAITLVTNTARINSDSGTLTLDVASGSAITSSNIAVLFGGAGNIVVNDAIATGAGTVTKDGAGTVTFNAANTYTSATTVNNGVLKIRHNSALGTTASGTTVNSNTAMQLENNVTITGEALSLNGTGRANDGALRSVSGNNTYAGLISLSGITRINADEGSTLTLDVASGNAINNAQDLTFGGAGTIWIKDNINTGAATLEKDGTGTLILNATNSRTGAINVNAGVLQVGVGGVGNTGTTASGVLTVGVGATLAGSGTVSGAAGVTNHVLNGLLSPGDLGGASNGTLTIQGNLDASASTAQLLLNILTPTGTYATPSDLGTSPGGSTYINAMNSIATTFGTSTAGTMDHLVGTGASVLTLSGNSTIQVTYTGTGFQQGQVFNLLDWSSIVSGGFDTGGSQRAGGAIGDLILPDLVDPLLGWDTSKFFSDGLLVVVGVVPEPSKTALLMIAMAACLFQRRRRLV